MISRPTQRDYINKLAPVQLLLPRRRLGLVIADSSKVLEKYQLTSYTGGGNNLIMSFSDFKPGDFAEKLPEGLSSQLPRVESTGIDREALVFWDEKQLQEYRK